MALDEILLNRLKTQIASVLAEETRPVPRNDVPRGTAKSAVIARSPKDDKAISDLPKPILRFYFSAGPWMTVGYSEKSRGVLSATKKADPASGGQYAPTNGTKICHRITGGGRVLHGKDLIFSLIASKEHDESFRSVRLSYLKIHEAIKAGFESLGYSLRFYRCDENLPKGQDCFRFPIATDLGLGRRKIAGGAQKRSGRIMLHQESVKLIGCLDAEQLIQAICRGIEKIFCVRLGAADLDPELMKEAGELSRSRYEVEAVNYKH